ncbi:MAG: hypothetical protein QXT31_03440 [Candidatus Bathyarchaeia archaeon]
MEKGIAKEIAIKLSNENLDDWLTINNPPYFIEPKFDGERAICEIDEKVAIGNRHNSLYDEFNLPKEFITALRIATHGRPCLLDCELISGDGKNFYTFLSDRAKLRNLKLMVFDILSLDGNDLRNKPLHERKEILANTIKPNNYVKLVRGKIRKDRQGIIALFEKALVNGYEGIVVKPYNSLYKPYAWLKLKRKKTVDALILAIRKTDAWLKQKIPTSFLIGLKNSKGEIIPFGHVGSGLSLDEKAAISALIPKLMLKEDNEHIWLKAYFIVEVEYEEKLENSFRAPRAIRLRTDKDEVDAIYC